MDDPHLSLLEGCLKGNPKSLEDLVKIFQQKVFGLSLKFLWNPEDAEDATQEILIKVLTNLGGFRKESKLSTWVYRVAVNHLINFKKSIQEISQINFRKVQLELRKSNEINDDDSENARYLAIHIQAACTHAILLCLTRSYRISFLLGEVFRVSSEEGAWIMEISPENYRKKLSRARLQMDDFLGKECGLSKPTNPCHCKNRISYSLKSKRIDAYLELSEKLKTNGEWKNIKSYLPETDEIRKAAEIYREGPDFHTRKDTLALIKEGIATKQWKLLN